MFAGAPLQHVEATLLTRPVDLHLHFAAGAGDDVLEAQGMFQGLFTTMITLMRWHAQLNVTPATVLLQICSFPEADTAKVHAWRRLSRHPGRIDNASNSGAIQACRA